MHLLFHKVTNSAVVYIICQFICLVKGKTEGLGGEEILKVNIATKSPKEYSLKWSRGIRTIHRSDRNIGKNDISFICTENNDVVSCINSDDSTSVCVENSSNKSAANKQTVAQIVAIVYRKLDEVKKKESTSFYLTVPPLFSVEVRSTTDNCHPCGNFISDVKRTRPPSQSCGYVRPQEIHLKKQPAEVKCVPFEFEGNTVQYLCLGKEFNEPQHISVHQQLLDDPSKVILTVGTDTVNNLIRKRRCKTHMTHLKAYRKQKSTFIKFK